MLDSNAGEVSSGRTRWLFAAVVIGVLALGLARAYGLRWYCDDTFITLRYVENFLAGDGLVYNQGEYVEGYTHFLWLLLLAFSGLLGIDTLNAAMALGIASFLGVLAVFCLISYRCRDGKPALLLPFTALALALNHDFVVWATGGLETMFLTFLFSAAFYLYFFSGRPRRARLFGTGVILILAALTRPDAGLIFILANAFVFAGLVLRRPHIKEAAVDLAAFNLPFFLLFAPYLIWKYTYYGGLLPNTYYAKSAGRAYFERGFFYIWLYVKPHFTSWLALLGVPAAAAGVFRRRTRAGDGTLEKVRANISDFRVSSLTFALVALLVYLVLFVARVGGDFMYARFIVPVIPFIMFVVEASVNRFARGSKFAALAAFTLIALAIGIVENENRDELLKKTEHGVPRFISHKGIIDEHYLRTVVDPIDEDRAYGEFLRPHLDGLDATALVKGRACLGYYAGFKTCIEYFGLTDEYIAHLPVDERSRPGHEKEAPHKYLIERGVDFAFNGKTLFFERARIQEFANFVLPGGNKKRVQLLTYDADLIAELARRMAGAFEFTNFGRYLDVYIARELPRKGRIELMADYVIFRDYYFLHNEDSRRERPFLERLGGAVSRGVNR